VSGTIARTRGESRIDLAIAGDPLSVSLSPAFAAGATLVAGQTGAQLQTTAGDTHVNVRVADGGSVHSVIRTNEAAEPAPQLATIVPGAK
jgi:hypothetical protein